MYHKPLTPYPASSAPETQKFTGPYFPNDKKTFPKRKFVLSPQNIQQSHCSILIVDDEHSGRTALRIMLKKYYPQLSGVIRTASTLKEAIAFVEAETVDLCFLDIQLGTASGFELLPYLPQETRVVFVTAYSEYAIQAIRMKALDYLLKPLNPVELQHCVDQFLVSLSVDPDRPRHLLIKEQGKTLPLPLSQIVFLKAVGAYSIIHLQNDKTYTTSKTLKVLQELIGDSFIRIHKSYIVHKPMIKTYTKHTLTTTNNKCLPVSRIGAKILSQLFS